MVHLAPSHLPSGPHSTSTAFHLALENVSCTCVLFFKPIQVVATNTDPPLEPHLSNTGSGVTAEGCG